VPWAYPIQRSRGASLGSDGIDLVDEDDGGGAEAARKKRSFSARGRHPRKHLRGGRRNDTPRRKGRPQTKIPHPNQKKRKRRKNTPETRGRHNPQGSGSRRSHRKQPQQHSTGLKCTQCVGVCAMPGVGDKSSKCRDLGHQGHLPLALVWYTP